MRIVFIFLFLVGLGGCGSDSGGSDEPTVAATTGILADITANVAGPDIQVEQVIPNGASPHDFALSADDRLLLEKADLVVADGAQLEATLPLDEVDTARWELTDHVGPLLPFEEAGALGDEPATAPLEEEEPQGAFDPHVWMDPSRVADALPSLADALAEVDPADADAFRARARDYARQLRELDRRMQTTLDSVAPQDRELVTSHDALGYFADRYGFTVIATTFPTSGPEAEASAASIDEVIDAVRTHDVPAVFAGEEDDPEALRLVADETGVTVVDDLIVESLGSAGSYTAMLQHDATAIADALDGT